MATAEPQATSNIIFGKVLEKESGRGVADLLIELFDFERWIDPETKENEGGADFASVSAAITPDLASLYKVAERVGSVLTNRNGEFEFRLSAKDFNLPRKGEQKPDLFLAVVAPDEPGMPREKRMLHLTNDVYLNAGSREAFIIRLPAALLAERGINLSIAEPEGQAERNRRAMAFAGARETDELFDREVASARAERANAEKQQRKTLRAELKQALTTDLAAAGEVGEILDEDERVEKKAKKAAVTGVGRFNTLIGKPPPPAATEQEILDHIKGGIPVSLYLTPDDRAGFGSPFDAIDPDHPDHLEDQYLEVPAEDVDSLLLNDNNSESVGTLLVNANPMAAFCASESFDERCAKQHTGIPVEHAHDDEEEEEEEEENGDESGSSTTETTEGELVEIEPGSGIDNLAKEDVATFVARLLKDMPSPDRVLNPDLITKRAKQEDLQNDVTKLALPKGPAEMPAKYHFSTLAIAFDHVWKQLFDEQIPDLAYTANHLGETRLGSGDVIKNAVLKNLVLNAKFLITPAEVPAAIARHFDLTKEEYNELSPTHRNELKAIAEQIAKLLEGRNLSWPFSGSTGSPTNQQIRSIQRLTEQGDRLIEAVRDDDYTSLHKTLRELQTRLNSAYEFTVFAADKDYHSVNFGLICTYEQEWTPLAIQPGKLVKTIPLAPKEERRYSIKSKRSEKRSSKEAKKHNRSLASEQSSTSRVEAEIIAKANSKTTFSLSAEGDYDIGISSGKVTTSFGTESANESSQSRKDFREAVLKASQEIKDEISFEISTESELSFESEESGFISNPNEELSLTLLFYELQKRYRIAERLYRVMPVVLVAQEVPSPDKITPAWVLSHDWILRRVLLDDSFRPALDYLASASVGDDFALREMRKNLRQQRNLVETLRLEFSAASMEADNRYTALARKIEQRIQEEYDERTDGFFSDVGEWFGGDGEDPEAAKAREMAAKDAHQYALEKAEKAAAALRQEVSTLHSLTDAYNKTVQARLDNETRVRRLLVHIRNNILYYMQAVWSMEPPDQQALRLHKVQVPVLELASRTYHVNAKPERDIFRHLREDGTTKHRAYLRGRLKSLPDPEGSGGPKFQTVSLASVADMKPIAVFGNYLAFRMNSHNALTEMMSAPYIDRAFGAMDPEELANVSLDQFSKYVCCLYDRLAEDKFAELKDELHAWLEQILASPLRNGDEIVVPTGSLFIESLVDPNPLLEDFKLKHRELDVYKVQEEVRKAGLENVRLAARLVNNERDDPDIEKKIVVQGAVKPTIDVDDA